jgi:3D (Asp-Asp-Asp) domain-containing protein
MKTKTKTHKLVLMLMVVFIATPISITSFKEKAKIGLSDLKKDLKGLSAYKEKEVAKNIVVKSDGIKYKDSFIPKTNNYRVLTVRLTVYWAKGGDTDRDSSKLKSSTGYTLKQGDSIAVDPRIIPYETDVIIPNVGLVKAVDTGTAVKEKKASCGKFPVIDVFFTNKKDAIIFANNNPKIVKVAVLN